MRYFGTVLIIVACAISCSFSNAQEPSVAQMPSSTPDVTASPETTAQPTPRDVSPDKKWEYIGGDEPKIVKAGTNEVALDLSDCGRGNPAWALDSKRFALNCWQGPRYQDTSLYQLRGGEWKTLKSPYDGVREILNKVIAAQVKKAGLPQKTDLRILSVYREAVVFQKDGGLYGEGISLRSRNCCRHFGRLELRLCEDADSLRGTSATSLRLFQHARESVRANAVFANG